MPKKGDRATQCSLLEPQTASAPTRKCGPCANKKIQVGMKSCLTDQSTQTVSNSMIPSTRGIRNYEKRSQRGRVTRLYFRAITFLVCEMTELLICLGDTLRDS